MVEKLKMDLYFLSWDETWKYVGGQNITWINMSSIKSDLIFSKP